MGKDKKEKQKAAPPTVTQTVSSFAELTSQLNITSASSNLLHLVVLGQQIRDLKRCASNPPKWPSSCKMTC